MLPFYLKISFWNYLFSSLDIRGHVVPRSDISMSQGEAALSRKVSEQSKQTGDVFWCSVQVDIRQDIKVGFKWNKRHLSFILDFTCFSLVIPCVTLQCVKVERGPRKDGAREIINCLNMFSDMCWHSCFLEIFVMENAKSWAEVRDWLWKAPLLKKEQRLERPVSVA
jgi:hypothetical protein